MPDSNLIKGDSSKLVLDVINFINEYDNKKVRAAVSVLNYSMGQFSYYGRVCITGRGASRLSCAQAHAKPGDIVRVFSGGDVPFLL